MLVVFFFPYCVFSTSYERVGIFIGCDYGINDERPLKYASRDAQQMAQLMQKNGGISHDRSYLLVNSSLEEVTDAFREIAGRLKEIHRTGKQTFLFFYYSGHGSSDALHIKNKKFEKNEFKKVFESLESDLKIAIIDACESGDFLRQKGARLIDHHIFNLEDKLDKRGTMIISSSSRGEMAQESEEYRGAVFTYHLMNGMQGLADYNSDGKVALMELFNYAGASTRMEHSRSQSFQQNPSYDFDVVGKTDVIIADLSKSRTKLLLYDIPARYIEIYDELNPELTTRAYLIGKDSIYYHLPSRKYVIKFTKNNNVFIRHIDLTWGKSASVSGNDFICRPNLSLYSKGGDNSINLNFHGFQASSRMSKLFDDTYSMYWLLGYVFRNSITKQTLNLGFTEFTLNGKNVPLVNEIRAFRLSYEYKFSFFRFVYGQFLAGGDISIIRVYQKIYDLRVQHAPLYVENAELQPIRTGKTNVFQLLVPLELEMFFPFSTWFSIWGSPGLQRYRDAAQFSTRYKILFELGASLGYQL